MQKPFAATTILIDPVAAPRFAFGNPVIPRHALAIPPAGFQPLRPAATAKCFAIPGAALTQRQRLGLRQQPAGARVGHRWRSLTAPIAAYPGQLRPVIGDGVDPAYCLVIQSRYQTGQQQLGIGLAAAIAKQIQRRAVEPVQPFGLQRDGFHR